MDELMLANVRAIADTERKLKEELQEDNKKANHIIRAFQERLCKNHGLGTPSKKSDDCSAVELVNALITDVNVVIRKYEEELKKENIEIIKSNLADTTKKYEQLQKSYNELLAKKTPTVTDVAQSSAPIPEKPDNQDNCSYVDDILNILKVTPTPEQASAPTTETNQTPPPSQPDNSLGMQILKLAGNSTLVKLDDLIDLCSPKLDKTRNEILEEITLLENAGHITVYRTDIKAPQGVTYAPVFALTKTGLQKAETSTPSQLDRWINLNPSMTYKEVPLLFYAVEEYLPKHGYSLVSFFEQKSMERIDKTEIFTPHVHLKDDQDNSVYLMYEGLGTRGASIHKYIDAYKHFTNGRMFFLCPNGKTANAVEGVIHYYKSKAFISNVADWAKYDALIKSGESLMRNGQPVPENIWFVQIR